MKKLVLLLITVISFPFVLFGHDNNVGAPCDAVINAALEITANYLQHKNDVEPSENLEFKTKKDSIDWSDSQFIKWQIIEPKDSLKIINYE